MYVAELVIHDPIGLHVRPAGQIVKLVKDSGLEILLGKKGQELISAASPLRVIGLGAKAGETLIISINTQDLAVAKDLADQIQELLRG